MQNQNKGFGSLHLGRVVQVMSLNEQLFYRKSIISLGKSSPIGSSRLGSGSAAGGTGCRTEAVDTGGGDGKSSIGAWWVSAGETAGETTGSIFTGVTAGLCAGGVGIGSANADGAA